MREDNDDGDHDDRENRRDDTPESDWVSRHLAKIIVLVGALCLLGLIGRALTG